METAHETQSPASGQDMNISAVKLPGRDKYTEVWTNDEKEFDANHAYVIREKADMKHVLGTVRFQKGPILENGVNGIHNEDLLAIVIHRLQSFNEGPFRCRENSIAITKLEEAVHWLAHRTAEREARGVEGTSQV